MSSDGKDSFDKIEELQGGLQDELYHNGVRVK